MAPIKFEEGIKEKLEGRTIEPSIQSWDRLAKQLDKSNKKSGKKYWWMGIAATFLLALIAVPFFIEESSQIETKNDSYSVEEPKIEIKEDPVSSEKETEISFDSQESLAVGVNDNSGKNRVETKYEATIKPEEPSKVTDETYYAELSEPSTKKDIEIKTDQVLITEIDKSKVDEVLQEAKITSGNNLNREVDSLLKAAQKQLFVKKEIMSNTQIVDADLLLKEAEEEVAPSLKTKVYRVIESGFKKVKTAVAQRNNK